MPRPRHHERRLISALILPMALAACGGQDSDADNATSNGSGAASQQAAASASDKQPGQAGEVVARVNGTPITRTALEVVMAQKQGDGNGQISREQALEQLINAQILAQEAEERGLDEDPKVAAKIDVARQRLLVQALVDDKTKAMSFSEEALRKEYERQVAQIAGDEYKARHILTEDRKAAEAVIAKLDQGSDFAELAKARSTAPSADQGGQLGWFEPGGMVEAFSEATASLDKGEYTSEPVKTKYGWHVIKLEDQRSREAPAYEEVKGQLQQILANRRVQEYLQELRADADVEKSLDKAQ